MISYNCVQMYYYIKKKILDFYLHFIYQTIINETNGIFIKS